jgi:HSP20 family protein
MHALHRPHLPRAIALSALTAVVAIILTLALASRLNDLASAPAPAAVSAPVAVARASATLPRAAPSAARSPHQSHNLGRRAARKRPITSVETQYVFEWEVHMALIRWEPIAELNTLQNEMNRLFNTFFDQPAATGRGGVPGRPWIPAMDLVETDQHYVLRADLPGLTEEDINVEFLDNVLTISGERSPEHETQQEGYYRLERPFGGFSRSLALPAGVEPDALEAHFELGVLEIRIPKPERKKPRQVQIKLSAHAGEEPKTVESGNAEIADPQANGNDPVPALA